MQTFGSYNWLAGFLRCIYLGNNILGKQHNNKPQTPQNPGTSACVMSRTSFTWKTTAQLPSPTGRPKVTWWEPRQRPLKQLTAASTSVSPATSDPQKMISNNPGPIVAHSTPSPTLRRGTWRKRKKTLSSCNFCKKEQRQVPLLQFWRRICQKSPTPINTMSFWGLPTWDFWISDLRYPAYHHAPLDPKLWWFFGSVHSPQPETLPPSHPQK